MKLCWRAVIVALFAVACQRTAPPEWLTVSALAPSEVQLGSELKLVGEGFALGKPANVTLRGELFRPGVLARPLVLRVPATTQSQTELVFSLSRQLQASLCGEPEHASHATFRGDIEVAIASRRPGTPPVLGTLRGAVLELYPAQKSEAAEASSLERGRRMLEFLGLEVTAVATGMEVVSVAPASRAQRAGIAPGDRIVSAAGVSVLEPSDLVTLPARSLELVVARGHAERRLRADIDGFARVPPLAVGRAGILVGAFALVFLVFASPCAGPLRRLEHGLCELLARLRERQSAAPAARLRLHFPLRAEAWLVFVLVGALLVAPLAGFTRFDPLHGLLALWLAARVGMSSLALVHGGRRDARHWSLRQGTRVALCELCVALPAVVALGAALSEPGVDLGRVLARQGALPWEWAALESPAMLLLFVIFLLTALPQGHRRGVLLRAGISRGVRMRARADSSPGWLHVCVVAALASVVFLGGDRLPPGASELLGAGPGARVVAASVLLLKAAAVVALIGLIRAAAYQLTGEQWARVTLSTCLPAALALAGLQQLWQRAGTLTDSLRWLDRGFAPAALAASLLLLVALGLRVAKGWGRRHAPSPVSPWL
jgi:PDZ domain-containing protein